MQELQRRSCSDPSWFWPAVLEDIGMVWRRPYDVLLDLSHGVPFARWFLGGRVNVIDTCLGRHAAGERQDAAAVLYEGEDGTTRRLSYRQLQDDVHRLAAALQALGLEAGDRVGLYLPMVPESVVALLATAAIGAVAVPLFSGFGEQAVASRLEAAGARFLITADGFSRRGRLVPMKEIADRALSSVPTVERVLVVRRSGLEVPMQAGRDLPYEEALQAARLPWSALEVDSDQPLMLLYTSGTTGRPKGAVHTHTGFPLKAAQDMRQAFDVRSGDRVLWVSDLGWMMGPWLIFGSLWLGATVVLYDGALDTPGVDRLWAVCERQAVTVLGVAPTLVRTLMAHGEQPVRGHDLSRLRVLGSTGEPWNPEPWQWFFDVVGEGRCPIINYSGGTEISGGILGCFPTLPLKPAAFSAPLPGIDADVVDLDGRSVSGEVGELAIRNAWPGMTQGFWQEPQRFLETYFEQVPGLWIHGDFAQRDADGFFTILGRSDDTIKVAGKRVGPVEVESILVGHPDVLEAVAIGVPHELKGQTIVGLVVLRSEAQESAQLRQALVNLVAVGLGRALKPESVHFVDALPKTRNAKVMRRLVRRAYLHEPLGDLSGLEDPMAVEAVRSYR